MNKTANIGSNGTSGGLEGQDSVHEGSNHRTLPCRDGNAYHTLCEAQVVEMADHLYALQPTTTSAALSLLQAEFPDVSVDLRLRACDAYTENVQSTL